MKNSFVKSGYKSRNKELQFDIIMPLVLADMPIAEVNFKYIKENLQPRKIIVIGSAELCDYVKKYQVDFINEDELFSGMSLQRIKNIIKSRIASDKRAGWYFQQFLKMAYALKCKDPYYVIWDADTIPLNPIEFITSEGKLIFNMKKEYNKKYFEIIKTMFSLCKMHKKSFISEHMIIDKNIMKKLIIDIENISCKGHDFYEKILYLISQESLENSGFSEFETYGTYVMAYYSNDYVCLYDKKSLRRGKRFIGYPIAEYLSWSKKSYNYISFEKSDYIGIAQKICKNKLVRKWIRLDFIVFIFSVFIYFPKGIFYKLKRNKR